MAKADLRTCRYKACKHPNGMIDLKVDSYIADGRSYYHSDCFEEKQKDDEKEKQEKAAKQAEKSRKNADMKLIANLWVENISNTVMFSQLYGVLNKLIDRGISSEYLVFVMQYVIGHHMTLRYPAGLTYYIDRQEIKDAYNKQFKQVIPQDQFVVKESQEIPTDNTPKFSVPKKPSGFQSILGKK